VQEQIACAHGVDAYGVDAYAGGFPLVFPGQRRRRTEETRHGWWC